MRTGWTHWMPVCCGVAASLEHVTKPIASPELEGLHTKLTTKQMQQRLADCQEPPTLADCPDSAQSAWCVGALSPLSPVRPAQDEPASHCDSKQQSQQS